MTQVCKEFRKIENEFYERIKEFQRIYNEVKKEGNVNLDGGKNFFEELENFKREIIEKSEKLSAKTPKDINAETRVYLGEFTYKNIEIFENLRKSLFINGKVDFIYSKRITKIPPNLVFNEEARFYGCTSLTKISENVVFNGNISFNDCISLTKIPQNTVFNGNAYFDGCISLSDETIEQLKQMKSDGKIKGILVLPDGTTIR